MKKTIRLCSFCLIAVMLMAVLVSCGNSEKDKFVGTWYELDSDDEETGTKLVLANDGTGSISEDGMHGSVNWTLKDGKLFLTLSMCGVTETTEYTYEFAGETMILTDAEDAEDVTIFRKK